MRLVLDLQGYQSNGSRMRGIGRYSLSLALAMAKRAGRHDLLVALNDSVPDVIESLRGKFQQHLPAENVVVWSSLNGTDALFPSAHWAIRSAELLFENAMARFRPDYIHISSLFEGWSGNVINSIGLTSPDYKTAVTLYDLIPLQCPDQYLADPALNKWYRRRIEHLTRADLYLAISEFSRQEGIDLLGLPAENVANISGSCSEIFKPTRLDPARLQELRGRYGITRPYVMYTGGFDSRKNIPALVRAFAMLSPAMRAAHQLVIVGYAPPGDLEELLELRRRCGLRDDECVITGYVPDEDLPALYSHCQLYVFPSLREGFGLPILEAMACGAVVIGADRTSLPEVIGLPEATFNPEDMEAIAARITQALTDQGLRARLQEHAKRQVAKFSWDECARKAWDAFEEHHQRQSPPATHITIGQNTLRLSLSLKGNSAPASLTGLLASNYDFRDEGPCDRTLLCVADEADVRTAFDALLSVPAVLLTGSLESLASLCYRAASACASEQWLMDAVAEQGQYGAMAATSPDPQSAGRALMSWLQRRSLGVIDIDHFLRGSVDGSANDVPALIAVIETAYRANDDQLALIDKLVAIEPAPPEGHPDWDHVARAMAENQALGAPAPRRLLVDMSELVVADAKSGIQRVVRNIIRALLASNDLQYSVHPVYVDRAGVFRHAHVASWRLLGMPEAAEGATDEVVEWRPEDTYLGLDLAADALCNHPQVFHRMKVHGVGMYFVVYDLIPLLRSDCVDSGAVPVFHQWYRTIAPLADGLVCISRSVADELLNWLDQEKPTRHRALSIGHFPLGADLDGHASDDEGGLPDGLDGRRVVLMVGTLEPRKGHAQALAAFEQLWGEGHTTALMIVGKNGWMVESLAERIRQHPEIGRRLFWLERATDTELEALYRRSDLLLAASEAEGFGLPLIEAAHRGLPVLARDIPVFREVAGEHAAYFNGFEPSDLATALVGWLGESESGTSPQSTGMQWVGWNESAHRLVDVVAGGHWYATYNETNRYWFPATDHRLNSQVGIRRRGEIHSDGRAGLLVYGPGARVESGSYVLRVFGSVSGDRDIRLDVVCEQGAVSLFSFRMNPANTSNDLLVEKSIHFEHDLVDLEIRVWCDVEQHVAIRGFELVPL